MNSAKAARPLTNPFHRARLLAFLLTAVREWPVLAAVWGRRLVVAEVALYVGAYVLYLLTRGLVHDDTRAVGIENGRQIVSFQESLGLLWEPAWQAWAIDHVYPIVVFLDWAYIVTYWPVILGLAVALFIINRSRYYYYRTVVMFTLTGALLTFMLFPVASPFAVPTVELVDTIQSHGPRFYGTPEMASYYNVSAAMPSLHFSWTVILGVFFVRSLPGWWRLLGVFYPVLTFFAIVITGNHFIVDAVGGGLLAVCSFGLVNLLQRAKERMAASRQD